MKRVVLSMLMLFVLLAVQVMATLRVPAQMRADIGRTILADETLFSEGAINGSELESSAETPNKRGYFLPRGSQPKLEDIEKRYGSPDRVSMERAPRLEPDIDLEFYKAQGALPPFSWGEVEVHYYGAVGFGVEQDQSVARAVFVTNKVDDGVAPRRERGPAAQPGDISPDAANHDGNWDQGFSSSNLFFTVVDNAVTNATISGISFSSCRDGGLISSSFDPPIPIAGDDLEFSVSGFTGKNVWSVTYEGTFDSETRVTGSKNYLILGQCGLIFGVGSNAIVNRLPDYVLYTSPGIRNILSGQSTSFTVGVKPIGSFSEAVQIQMQLPALNGVTVNLTSDRLQPGQTASINVSTVANAPDVLLGIILTSSTGQATHNLFAILNLKTFELTISPAARIVGKGESATFTINSRTAAFTSPVTLTASTSPATSNVGINFAASTITPGESTTFTATSTPTVATNSYSITITATSGPIRETASATYRVSDPDFSLAIAPTSQIVAPGRATSPTISVQQIVGFTQPVTLTASVSPSDGRLSATISPATVNPGGTATLSLSATSQAVQDASYTVTITGMSGSLTHTATTSVRISGPDFALAFDPATLTGERGATSRGLLNINRVGGFNGAVTIVAPDTDAIKVKVKPGEASTTDSSVKFKFKVKASAPSGPQDLVFTGRDDTGRQRTARLTLIIQ